MKLKITDKNTRIDRQYVVVVSFRHSDGTDRAYLRFHPTEDDLGWYIIVGGNMHMIQDHELVYDLETEFRRKSLEDYNNDKDS